MTTIVSLLETANAKASGLLSRFFATARDPLLRGDLLAYAKAEYPPETYPTAWKEIPEDVRRSLVWDGKMLNGRDVAELAKADVTDETLLRAVRKSGIRAAILALALPFAIPLASVLPFVKGTPAGMLGLFSSQSVSAPYPTWAADAGAWMPVLSWYALAAIEKVWLFVALAFSYGVPLFALFLVFWFFGFTRAMSSVWDNLSAPLRVMTRDTVLLHKTKRSLREKQYAAYCFQVEEATGRLKHEPVIEIGEATGTLRERGDMEAPEKGQIVATDAENLRQHMIVFGGTGSGKTRRVFKPLFNRLMNATWGEGHKIGAYITDGKGTLHVDLAPMVKHRDDVVTIGTEEGFYGVDLVKGMTPTEINSTFKAIAGQLAGAPASDDFWPTSAAILMMHSASLARGLEYDPETVAMWERDKGMRPYSLLGIALLATDENEANEAIECLKNSAPALNDTLTEEEKRFYIKAYDAAAWFQGTFFERAKETRSGVTANVESVLGHFRGADAITYRFCSGIYPRTVDVDHALKGGIVMSAIGETEHGTAGKVVNIWLKTRLYVLAQKRLIADPEACKTTTCAVMCDEFQMLATTGENSDSSTWAWSRQSGMLLIAATQSLASIQQVMGDAATSTLINLLRTKIVLTTEELSTIEYMQKVMGEAYRGFEYENLYATYAARQNTIGDYGTDEMNLGVLGGWFPKGFSAPTHQNEAYSTANLWSVVRRMSPEASQGSGLQLATRNEDRNRQAVVEGVTKGPKVDHDEFTLGAGFAVAIVQRAGVKRADIIRLKG